MFVAMLLQIDRDCLYDLAIRTKMDLCVFGRDLSGVFVLAAERWAFGRVVGRWKESRVVHGGCTASPAVDETRFGPY